MMRAVVGKLRAWLLGGALLLVSSAQAASSDRIRVWSDSSHGAHLSIRPSTAATLLVVAACEAERAEQAYWASRAERWGFATAQLDAVGHARSCEAVKTYDGLGATSPPLTLAIGAALAHLRTLEHVLADRIAVLGFTRSGILQVFAERQERPWRDRPAAGIAFAPDCPYPLNARFSTSTLTLADGQDSDEEHYCSVLMRLSSVGRAPIVRRVYPNADPDFAGSVLAVQDGAKSAAGNPENKAALGAAADAVREFLDDYLRPERMAAADQYLAANAPASLQVGSVQESGWTLLDHVLAGGRIFRFRSPRWWRVFRYTPVPSFRPRRGQANSYSAWSVAAT